MDPLIFAMLGAGFASGVHCVGMCGGIVTAFDASGREVIPIRPAASGASTLRRFAFNAGRISAYAGAGAAVSLLGVVGYMAGVLPGQQALGIAASVVLLLMGLYMLGLSQFLAPLEKLGLPLWRRLMPAATRLLSARTWQQAYAAGLLWGFLPCAMVYAALGAAALSGDPLRGALGMLAFGLGTLPFLLAAGWLASRIRAWRVVAGAALLAFGAFSLVHAAGVSEQIRHGLLCF